MTASEDVEIEQRATLYRGYLRVDRYRLRHRRHDGGWSRVIERELVERGHGAALLPYDPAADAVLLIEQFRVGALAAGLPPWQVEIPAGIIDPGETPEAVARRETAEEAGAAVDRVEPIGRFLLSSGALSETIALYCGRIDSRGLGGLHGLAEEDEDIAVAIHPFDAAWRLVESGAVANSFTVIALQWLALNRAALRQRWR
ncbi:MAG: NUDIX domain-containing protein [Dongiaceae bacterium]